MVVKLKFKRTLSEVSAAKRVVFARLHRLSPDESERFFDTFELSLPPRNYAPPLLTPEGEGGRLFSGRSRTTSVVPPRVLVGRRVRTSPPVDEPSGKLPAPLIA